MIRFLTVYNVNLLVLLYKYDSNIVQPANYQNKKVKNAYSLNLDIFYYFAAHTKRLIGVLIGWLATVARMISITTRPWRIPGTTFVGTKNKVHKRFLSFTSNISKETPPIIIIITINCNVQMRKWDLIIKYLQIYMFLKMLFFILNRPVVVIILPNLYIRIDKCAKMYEIPAFWCRIQLFLQ